MIEERLRIQALELLKENQQILVAPYGFQYPNTDNYLFIISDNFNTKHYFYKDENGELQYDGSSMKQERCPIKQMSDN